MRIAPRIALALAFVSLGRLASAQDPASGFPCDSDRQPLPEQAAPIEAPPSVPPSDPRNPSDARAFEDARREDGKASSGAEGSSFAGLPGADEEGGSAGETTSDPLTRAQALREQREREAAEAERARDEAKKALDAHRMNSPTGDDSEAYSRLCNTFSLLAGEAIRARQALDKAKKEEEAAKQRKVAEEKRLADEKAIQDAEEGKRKAAEDETKREDEAKKLAAAEAVLQAERESARKRAEEETRRQAREKARADRAAEDLARWLRALREAGMDAEADQLEKDILDALAAAQTGVETSLSTLQGVLGGEGFATALASALLPAAYGTFVAIVASHITAAGTAMIDKHEADLQRQDCDRMINSMKRDGASTYCERHEDGSAVFIQKNTDRQKGEGPYIITVLKPRTGVYSYR